MKNYLIFLGTLGTGYLTTTAVSDFTKGTIIHDLDSIFYVITDINTIANTATVRKLNFLGIWFYTKNWI
jgi:hypothetical protein